MSLLASLIFGLCAFCASGLPVQPTPALERNIYIPHITLDGRHDCGVRDLLTREIGDIKKCSMTFPEGKSSFFDTSDPLLCFGMFDTLYQLCSNTQSLSSFKVPEYDPKSFCLNASKAFDSYSFQHHNPTVVKWATLLRSFMHDDVNCSELCSFRDKEVRKECRVMVAALDAYSKPVAAVQQPKEAMPKETKPKAVTQSMETKSSSIAASEPENPKPAEPNDPPAPGDPAELKTDPVQQSAPVSKPEAEPIKPETQPVLAEPKSGAEEEADMEESEPGAVEGELPMLDPAAPDPLANVPAAKGPSTEEGKLFMEDDKEMADKTPFLTDERPGIAMFHKDDNEESNLVTYFILMTGGGLLFYVAFHNKNKLLALALEGRRTSRRGGRHSSASYSKLHSNLEEAIASGPTSPSATHVLY